MPKAPLPDGAAALLREPNPAVIAVVMPSGHPMSVATWYLVEDDGTILVNMDAERARLTWMKEHPHVSLTALKDGEWYTHVVMGAFRAAGADPTIGSRLQSILAAAGAEEVGGLAIAQYLSSDDPVGPAMLAAVVRSLAPVMVAHGLTTEAELDLDTLAARTADTLRSLDAVLVPPLLSGAWGGRP